ncbi:hypothetical protein XPA_000435 [Xanthoria parietina]
MEVRGFRWDRTRRNGNLQKLDDTVTSVCEVEVKGRKEREVDGGKRSTLTVDEKSYIIVHTPSYPCRLERTAPVTLNNAQPWWPLCLHRPEASATSPPSRPAREPSLRPAASTDPSEFQ